MPYLNIDPDFPDHPKTRRLIGLVGGNAEGLLVRLWCFIAKYHGDSGRLAGYTQQEIEAVVRWEGEPGKLVESLINLGWMHKDKGGYYVHDWNDHQGHIGPLKDRAKKGAAARWDKLRKESENGKSVSSDASSIASSIAQASKDASSIAQASLKQCSYPFPSLPKDEDYPPKPPQGEVGSGKAQRESETDPPHWQPMLDHMSQAWAKFKSKKSGNKIDGYAWPSKRDKLWAEIRAKTRHFQAAGMMALWDLFLAMEDDDWVRGTGYSAEAFLHKIPKLVGDVRFKSLTSKYEDRLLKPELPTIGIKLNVIGGKA